jgi:hypothetical protein
MILDPNHDDSSPVLSSRDPDLLIMSRRKPEADDPSNADEFPDVFPTIQYTPRRLSQFPCSLMYAYQSEVTFDSMDFDLHWGRGSVDLSDRLMLNDGGNPYIIPEPEFTGIPWHLLLNPVKTSDLGSFLRGTTIAYFDSNNNHNKYVIEHCLRESDGVTYLNVVFHTFKQEVYPAYHPKRPTFILVIPQHLNAVSPPDTSFFLSPYNSVPVLFSESQNSTELTESPGRHDSVWRKMVPSFLNCF